MLEVGSMPEGRSAGCSWSGVPKGTVRLVGWSVVRAGVQLLTNYFTSFSTPVVVWREGRPAREDAIPTWRYKEDMEQYMPCNCTALEPMILRGTLSHQVFHLLLYTRGGMEEGRGRPGKQEVFSSVFM